MIPSESPEQEKRWSYSVDSIEEGNESANLSPLMIEYDRQTVLKTEFDVEEGEKRNEVKF